MGFFDGTPVPVPPQSRLFPLFLRPASPSGASTTSFILSRRQHPSFPRRSRSWFFRRSRGSSVGAGLTTRSSEQAPAFESSLFVELDFAGACR